MTHRSFLFVSLLYYIYYIACYKSVKGLGKLFLEVAGVALTSTPIPAAEGLNPAPSPLLPRGEGARG